MGTEKEAQHPQLAIAGKRQHIVAALIEIVDDLANSPGISR